MYKMYVILCEHFLKSKYFQTWKWKKPLKFYVLIKVHKKRDRINISTNYCRYLPITIYMDPWLEKDTNKQYEKPPFI